MYWLFISPPYTGSKNQIDKNNMTQGKLIAHTQTISSRIGVALPIYAAVGSPSVNLPASVERHQPRTGCRTWLKIPETTSTKAAFLGNPLGGSTARLTPNDQRLVPGPGQRKPRQRHCSFGQTISQILNHRRQYQPTICSPRPFPSACIFLGTVLGEYNEWVAASSPLGPRLSAFRWQARKIALW